MTYLYWYCQSLGGVIGLIVCIYCYVRGDLLLITNLSGNFDFLNFGGILASYILYPLCIITSFLGVFSHIKKEKLGKKFKSFNKTIITITLITGFLGCSIYFIFPTLVIIFPHLIKSITFAINSKKEAYTNKNCSKEDDIENKDSENDTVVNTKNKNLQKTKEEMALELLNNNADLAFIEEVTGLTPLEVDKLHIK